MNGMLLGLVLWCSGARTEDAAEDSLAHALPGGAIFFAELGGGADVVRGWPASGFARALGETRLAARVARTAPFAELLAGRAVLEMAAGLPAAEALAELLGRRMAVAVYPGAAGGSPRIRWVADLEDATRAEHAFGVLRALLDFEHELVAIDPSVRWEEGFRIPGGPGLARVGDRLVGASDGEALAAAGPLAEATNDADTLDRSPVFRRWWKESLGTAPLRFLVLPGAWQALPGAAPVIPERLDNALASLLFGDLVLLLRTSAYVSGRVDANAEGAFLELSFPLPRKQRERPLEILGHGTRVAPLLELPLDGSVLQVALSRQWSEWWSRRELFLDDSVERGFAEADSTLSLFFGGHSLPGEILPALDEGALLVVSRQTYPGREELPGTRFPAGALVLQPTDADVVPQFTAAFPTLIGIVNLERGREGKAPLQMRLQHHGDTEILEAYFPDTPDGGLDRIRFNFSPAIAYQKPWLVLSTSRELLGDVLDALPARPPAAGSTRELRTVTALRLQAAAGLSLFRDNRDVLHTQQILDKGKSEAEATRDLDLTEALVELLEGLDVTVSQDHEVVQARAELRWQVVPGAAPVRDPDSRP